MVLGGHGWSWGAFGRNGWACGTFYEALLKCLKKKKDNTKNYTCWGRHFGLGGLGGLGGPRSHGGPTDAILIVAQKCI